MTEKVELVINLEPWEDGKQYDRLGMDSQTTSILDIAVPRDVYKRQLQGHEKAGFGHLRRMQRHGLLILR